MAHWIKPDGPPIEVHPKNGRDFQLEEIREFLEGGYMEVVTLPSDQYMVVDEDGKRKQLAYNSLATTVAQHVLQHGDYIAGPALVCRKGEIL